MTTAFRSTIQAPRQDTVRRTLSMHEAAKRCKINGDDDAIQARFAQLRINHGLGRTIIGGVTYYNLTEVRKAIASCRTTCGESLCSSGRFSEQPVDPESDVAGVNMVDRVAGFLKNQPSQTFHGTAKDMAKTLKANASNVISALGSLVEAERAEILPASTGWRYLRDTRADSQRRSVPRTTLQSRFLDLLPARGGWIDLTPTDACRLLTLEPRQVKSVYAHLEEQRAIEVRRVGRTITGFRRKN